MNGREFVQTCREYFADSRFGHRYREDFDCLTLRILGRERLMSLLEQTEVPAHLKEDVQELIRAMRRELDQTTQKS